jgi:hypothetical protein
MAVAIAAGCGWLAVSSVAGQSAPPKVPSVADLPMDGHSLFDAYCAP